MKTDEYTIALTGRGETKEKAIGKVFSQVQGSIQKLVKGVPIRIEPKEVAVTSAHVTRYTERFLGLLFPRERTNYMIEASVTVQVTFLDTSEIEFTEHKEQLRPLQHALKLR